MSENSLWSEFIWGALHSFLFYPLQFGHHPGGTNHGVPHFLDFSSLSFHFLPDLFLTAISHKRYCLTALLVMGSSAQIWPSEYPHHP